MDNDLPWNPPEPQQRPLIPKNSPQVPDVTLFSPTNKPGTTIKTNFLQRALANEKVLNIPKQPIKSNYANNQPFNNEMFSKPSVPDLSLFDPQVLNTANRIIPTRSTTVSPKNQLFTKTTSKENIFGAVGKPSVPDVTILDEEPKKKVVASERITDESYKTQLLKSHEQFMKQIRSDPLSSTEPANGKRKSPLFNQPTTKYQENPLRKYAPQLQPAPIDDGNSSSILIETDDVSHSSTESADKSDEMTFKKVAEMLCEIQKLVIPTKGSEQSSPHEKTPTSSSQKCAVLRSLATTYLTTKEIETYDIENELEEIESNS